MDDVLISFREWLHSYYEVLKLLQGCFERCSHLFQRVASFLQNIYWKGRSRDLGCSHLFQRVASFLQVLKLLQGCFERLGFSSLSESGFIPTCWTARKRSGSQKSKFSSLSESGFIPTSYWCNKFPSYMINVLISFREWLHSYRF